MMEIAIGERHAGDRTAERPIVGLVQVETRFERNALDRGADGLATDLQRVAGQADVPDRTFTGELHGAGGAHVVENAARAAGAIETGEGEDLAGDEPTRLVGVHHPGQGGSNHGAGRNGTQYKTRKHAV